MNNRDPREVSKAGLIGGSHTGNGYEELKGPSEASHVELPNVQPHHIPTPPQGFPTTSQPASVPPRPSYPPMASYPGMMVPPAPRLAYPIVYQSNKPVATEPMLVDYPSVPGVTEPTKAIDKLVHSLSSASNNFQVCDLIDATDIITFRCPRCQYEGQSKSMNTLGPCTYFGILALCCTCTPCAPAPCFIKRCQYIQHYCPNCNQKIGVTYPG